MNFIFVCQQNPWSLNGGALIRNYWMVRALALEHTVHLVTADDATEPVPPDFQSVLGSLSRFPRGRGPAARANRGLQALRPRSSYYTSGAVTPALKGAVRALACAPHTAAMLDLQLCNAIDGLTIPYIYNAHNNEHELLKRRAALESQPLRSLLLLDAARTRALETDFIRRSALVAACSEEDRLELSQLAPTSHSKIILVPNGVDVSRYAAVAAQEPETRRILVTGSFDWRPNRIALDWFMREVLPELRLLLDNDFEVRVAGRMSDDLANLLNEQASVTAVARPADIRDELSQARIIIAPILASSGTRLRILEGWAAARPIATTTAGAQGLNYRDGNELVIGDGARPLAQAAARLLEDRDRWRSVRRQALARAREYDWPAIAQKFVSDVGVVMRATNPG